MSLKITIVAIVSSVMAFGTATALSQADQEPPQTSGAQAVESEAASTQMQMGARKPTESTGSFPEDQEGLQDLAVKSYEDGEYLRFVQATIKLRELRPDDPMYLIGMVVGAALIGRQNTAYNYMHKMQQQGLSYDFNSTEDTQSIRTTEVYDYLNDLLIKAGEPMGEGAVAFTLPEVNTHPESIAWDESRDSFLVGTIETGAVLSVTPDGEIEELIRSNDENGLLAILGVAVDQKRNRLWVSSAGVPGFAGLHPTDMGRGALYEFDLETLEVVNQYYTPVDGLPHIPGNIAVTPTGDVYVIDRAYPIVLRKLADSDQLESFVGDPEMTAFKDLALSDSGQLLYVADKELGILVIDLERGLSNRLSGPDTMNLTGLSGLTYNQGRLFTVQNGITPQRMLRLELDASGKSVAATVPVAVALEQFNYPSFGAIHGDNVYYFANGNMPGSNSGSSATLVMKSPTDSEKVMISPEKRRFNADVEKNLGKTLKQ